MGKKKGRAKGGIPAGHAVAFDDGARVMVKSGDYGNARGTVEGITASGLLVRLDNRAHGEPVEFQRDNLTTL